MNIYLMVKTHHKTGLKYLCKTTQNPLNYRGSGEDWKPHLKEHGKEHKTEIIKTCSSKEEFSYWGRYYSRLWNVVGAMDDFGNKIWANRIPETGGGPGHRHSEKVYKTLGDRQRGKKNKNISSGVKQSWKDPLRVEKQRLATTGDKHYKKQTDFMDSWNTNNPSNDPVSRKKMEDTWVEKYGVDNPMKSSVVTAKVTGDKHYSKQPGWESPIKGDSHYTAKEGYVSQITGNKHYTKKADYKIKPTNSNYDHTVYTWVNIQTGEVVVSNRRDMITQYKLNPGCVADVINGKRTIHKNWQVKK